MLIIFFGQTVDFEEKNKVLILTGDYVPDF